MAGCRFNSGSIRLSRWLSCSSLNWRGLIELTTMKLLVPQKVLCAVITFGLVTFCVFAAEPNANELLAKAQAAFDRGNRDEAFALADKAVQADPKHSRALFLRGQLYGLVREHEKAIADFDRVIELDPRTASAYQARGSERFKLGRIEASISDFDKFLEFVPSRESHHWQRGISYYYAGRFADGQRQFELHQTVNPNDVENAVWHYLCLARAVGVEKARSSLLDIKHDRRVPMMEIYALFRGTGTVEAVLNAVHAGDPPPDELRQRFFYAHLYLGLYYEANGQPKPAREHITKAAEQYRVEHYMGDVARVHLQLLRQAEKKTTP